MLAINAALDEELTVEMEEFANTSERIVEMRKKNKAFHKNMIVNFRRCVGDTKSVSKKLIVVTMMLTPKQLGRTPMKKLSTRLLSWVI